jgi:threonine dehydratase
MRLALAGRRRRAELFVKAEHLQVSGSFKVRGAINRVAALSEPERLRGVIASNGNHDRGRCVRRGRGRRAGDRGHAVVASPTKIAATGYGAQVILHGQHFGEASPMPRALRDEQGLT